MEGTLGTLTWAGKTLSVVHVDIRTSHSDGSYDTEQPPAPTARTPGARREGARPVPKCAEMSLEPPRPALELNDRPRSAMLPRPRRGG